MCSATIWLAVCHRLIAQTLHRRTFPYFGAHSQQNNCPHSRQWCLLRNIWNSFSHFIQESLALSGSQRTPLWIMTPSWLPEQHDWMANVIGIKQKNWNNFNMMPTQNEYSSKDISVIKPEVDERLFDKTKVWELRFERGVGWGVVGNASIIQ